MSRFVPVLFFSGVLYAMYVVQTIDNQLHFISDTVESFPIPFRTPLKPTCSEIASIVPDEQQHRNSSPLPDASRGIGPYHGITPSNSHSQIVNRRGRIDGIYIDDTGCIVYQEYRIPLASLYSQPFAEDGIFVGASKKNRQHMIRDTCVIISDVCINICDFTDHSKKDIAFSFIVDMGEAYRHFEIRDSSVLLDDRWYKLSDTIVAVYEREDGAELGFLVRLFSNYGFDVFHSRNKVGPRRGTAIYSLPHIPRRTGAVGSHGLVLSLVLVLATMLFSFGRRNLKYGTRLGRGVYEGSFVGQPCLIYHVDSTEIQEANKYMSVKSDNLIHILFAGKIFFRYVVVTERTRRYAPPGDSNDSGSTGVEEAIAGSNNVVGAGEASGLTKNTASAGAHAQLKEDLLVFAKTIERMHDQNTVHSRISPENMRVAESGSLRVQGIFGNGGWQPPRQLRSGKHEATSADDVFSMGCTIHFYLTGYHPFDTTGSNIEEKLRRNKNGADGEGPGSDSAHNSDESNTVIRDKAKNVGDIKDMNSNANKSRHEDDAMPNTAEINGNILRKRYAIRIADRIEHDLVYHCVFSGNIVISRHPYFWDYKKKIEFICDFSDFIEGSKTMKARMEKYQSQVFLGDWTGSLDAGALVDMQRKRHYDTRSLTDLIRFVRNTHRHINELPNREFYNQFEGKVCGYCLGAFPRLFMTVYRSKTAKEMPGLRSYFES